MKVLNVFVVVLLIVSLADAAELFNNTDAEIVTKLTTLLETADNAATFMKVAEWIPDYDDQVKALDRFRTEDLNSLTLGKAIGILDQLDITLSAQYEKDKQEELTKIRLAAESSSGKSVHCNQHAKLVFGIFGGIAVAKATFG